MDDIIFSCLPPPGNYLPSNLPSNNWTGHRPYVCSDIISNVFSPVIWNFDFFFWWAVKCFQCLLTFALVNCPLAPCSQTCKLAINYLNFVGKWISNDSKFEPDFPSVFLFFFLSFFCPLGCDKCESVVANSPAYQDHSFLNSYALSSPQGSVARSWVSPLPPTPILVGRRSCPDSLLYACGRSWKGTLRVGLIWRTMFTEKFTIPIILQRPTLPWFVLGLTGQWHIQWWN